ncbi:transcription antitermination factor NusB [Mycoplasmatota bacterium WC44]
MTTVKEKRLERESILKILYMIDMVHCNLKETYKVVELSDYVRDVTEGVIYHLDAIDEIITSNLSNWTLKRLNYVDRAIIRSSVYEMMFTDLNPIVIINEAVELSKKYSQTDDFNSKAFNNKLLDKIRVSLNK